MMRVLTHANKLLLNKQFHCHESPKIMKNMGYSFIKKVFIVL